MQAEARELLPFPSQQIQQAPNAPAQRPPAQSSYLTEFQRSIDPMNCGQLQALRAKLAESQRTASLPADQHYFGQLVDAIDRRRTSMHC